MTRAIEPMTASWKRAVLPAILLLALNLFVFGTMTVYFGNQGEFLVEDEDILKVLLVPAGALVLLLALVTVPLSRWRPAATGAVTSGCAGASVTGVACSTSRMASAICASVFLPSRCSMATPWSLSRSFGLSANSGGMRSP